MRADDTTHGTPLPRELVAPFCAAAAEAGSRMRAAAASRPFAIVGSGAALVAEAAASGSSIVVRKPPERLALLTALAAMARAGACTRIEPHQLEPTYLRKSDAEIKREWSA